MQDEPIVNLSGTPNYPNYSVDGSPASAPLSDALYTPLDDKDAPVRGVRDSKGMSASDITMSQAAPYKTGRFPNVMYGYNNEEIYAQGQSFGSKMVSGIGKGLVLTGTTFLQSTAGLLNGLAEWRKQGKLAGFYNNEFNRSLDEFNKQMEDILPNYYTQAEKAAHWYAPSKLFSANFLWDGIVKNLGFAAGAALAGGVYGTGIKGVTSILTQIPKLAKLVSIGKAAEALAATETTLLDAEKIGESAGKLKSAYDKFLGTYNVLNTGQRVTVAGLATTGEATFEALNNLNQYRDEQIAEYRERNGGRSPIGEELKKINDASEGVGNASLAWNIALLSATNYIQFPKILGSSYKAEKGVINNVIRETKDVVREGEKYVEKKAWGGPIVRGVNKVRPYLFSTSEGFEEGAQYAITVGTQDYFDKKRLNKDPNVLESIVEGVKKTLTTDEGMENVLIGGLSGALMLGKGKFKESRELSRNTAEALKSFNSSKLSDFTKETLDGVNRGVVIQEEREQALKEGKITESKDLEKDYIINYLIPRLKFGRYDMVSSDITDYKQLASTEEGWAQLVAEGKAQATDTKEAYVKRLTNLEQTAKNMKSMYQSLHIRYGGITDEKGKAKYPSDVIDKMVYASTKIIDYDERITSLIPSLAHPELMTAGVDASTIIKDLSKGNYESFNSAAELISVMDDINKDEVGEALNSIGLMVPRRENFRKEYEDMKITPEKWTEKEVKIITPEELEKLAETEDEVVELETIRGKGKFNVGKTYFLGSGIDYDKNGLEKHIEIPEFKILKDNGDTVDVLTNKGEVKTIGKDVFKKYHVSDLSTLKDNDSANFFYHHRNEKFEFNFGKGKDGKPRTQQGRIEYKDGKLFFVYPKYNDRKTGKVVLTRMEVSREQFFPKGEFNQPMIKKIGTIETKDQTAARERLTDEKKRREDNKKIEESTRKRNNLLTELFVELSEKQTIITELINKKKAELKNIIDGLELLREDIESPNAINKSVKKTVRFKKHAKKYLEAASRLSRMKDDIEYEVANLERQKEDIEIAIAYVEDASHYNYELSPDIEGFTKEIEDQLTLLELTAEENTKQISRLHKILSSIEKAIDSVVNTIHSLVVEFETKYPKAPNAIIGQQWVDFIQANPNFLKLKPEYKADLQTLEDIVAETEEFEISPNEKKAQEVRDEIEALQKEVKEIEPELIGLRTILDKFKPYAEQAKQQKLEEEKLGKDNKETSSAEKTMSSNKAGVRNANLNKHDEEYEPDAKKNDKHVVSSTVAPDDGKAHQKRVNLFGAKLAKFKNKANIRGVYITSKNEHLLIPGLTNFLFPKTSDETEAEAIEKQKDIIALVMAEVDEKTGKLSLVDVNGKVLKEGQDPLENGIFQVFPTEKLRWSGEYGNESMFRKTTPEEVQTSLRKEYAAWRDGIFKKAEATTSKEDLLNITYTINASFGIPSYVMKDDNTIDYSTRTSVEDAHLITENEMHNQVILEIPTTNDVIENGSVKFTNVLGRVFAKLSNGYAKLHNRQLNKKEAYAVYKVIHRLSELMMETDGMTSEEAKRLLTYLRSVVFWRAPEKGEKEFLGRNNIYFKRDVKTKQLTLYISDDGTNYAFKPSALEENRKAVIESLQSLFMNINNHMIKDVNESYEEITDINDKGEIVATTWENYQTYLLSKKNRIADEVPLTTWMKPIISDDETNRHGIYFYVEDDGESPIIPEYKKQTKKPGSFKAKSATETSTEKVEGGRTEEESKKIAIKSVKWAILQDILERKNKPSTKKSEEEGFSLEELEDSKEYTLNLDRKKGVGTVNIFTTKEGRNVRFVAQSDVSEKNYESAIGIAPDGKVGQFEEIVQIYIEAGKTKDEKKTKKEIKEKPVKEIEEKEESFSLEELENTEDVEKQIGKPLSQEAKDALTEIEEGEKNDVDDEDLRQARESSEPITVENWNIVESWLKKNFPHIPLYRVKNIMMSTNGKQAWGMFKNGALYLYQNAEVGTIYHEVFHAIWQMSTTPEERVKIYNEFKQRSGTFYDLKSEKTFKYSDPAVTMKMANEKMAEEFRDYVQDKKIPPKPADGRPFIVKLFSDLVNIIKSFFVDRKTQSAIEELFSTINTGGYKSSIPFASSLNFVNKGVIDIEDEIASEGADYSLVRVSDRQRADVIEHMTYLLIKRVINKDENLFNIPNIKKSEIYPELKDQIFKQLKSKRVANKILYDEGSITKEQYKQRNAEVIRLIVNIDSEWDSIINRHEEYLKGYNIEFDENDHIQLHNNENTGKDDYQDARKMDSFRKANAAIKLLLATIPKTTIDENGKVQAIRTSIGGVSLIPSSQTVINLWNKLSHSINIDDMMDKLRQMAKDDSNYRVLYKRLMKTEFDSPGNHSFEKINTTHASQLLNAFWNTFKKQNPSVQNIFVLDNGEVVVGEASLSTAAMQFRDDYEKNIVLKAKEGKGFFKWDKKSKKFIGDPVSMRGVLLDSPQAILSFLGKLGMAFTGKELNYLRINHPNIYSTFKEAVGGIRSSIINSEEIVTFGGKALDIKGRLLELGLAKSIASNPTFDSAFFNIVGERMQSYIGPNAASNLYDVLSSIKNTSELRGTQYEYLLTDSFAQGSNLMKRLFDEEGDRRSLEKELLKTGYAGGIMYSKSGKSKEASRLTYMERLIQELNLNLKGWFLNLIPGDASIEWMVQMGNPISTTSLRKGFNDVHKIFGEYFISELNLAREDRKGVTKKRKELSKEMRFFKEILEAHSKKLYTTILSQEGTSREVYEENKEEINKAIEKYIKQATDKTERILTYLNILEEDEKGFTLKNIDLPVHMKRDSLTNELTVLTINYMIANIEMHKVLYSDPYQYNDELKRIKSFISPRQSIISGSLSMNTVLNNVWNKGFNKKDIGHTDFIRDYFKTATLTDVIAISNLPGYDPYEETDGSGIITFKAYRNFRIRASNWNDREESQFRYDIAWEKQHKNIALTQEEQSILDKGNPKVQSAYTPLKPIVSGNKANDKDYNDIVLDKYALYPLSYRVISDININGGKETSNSLSLYDKMQKEDLDYVIFNSARKVGAEETNNVYDAKGNFVTSPYKGIINIPFSIMSLQTEVPAKEGDNVTRGSQVTKLITMDFMEAGVPIDFLPNDKFENRYAKWTLLSDDDKKAESSLFKEIKNNQTLLEALMEDGYQTLLNKLGIKETINKNGNKEYNFSDFSMTLNTLKDEILKREVNDNLIDAINSFGKETSLLESTPAYQQVRNILYSIVDRVIVSPKMPGGLKVQIPSTFFEQQKLGITKIVGKKGYQSDTLEFYSRTEDGKKVNVCQIMVKRWFKSDMSDKALLDYLNTTDEGKRILRGIAFRIPTQKQNSIDVFEIRQFLPTEFGDSVVVPSEIVRRSGADFDIDKLSIYLKNIYKNAKGELKAVPFFGYGEEAKNKIKEVYESGEFLTDNQRKELNRFLAEENDEVRSKFFSNTFDEEGNIIDTPENKLIRDIFSSAFTEEALTKEFVDEIRKDGIENKIINSIYKKSLENAYIESSDALISHPLNYDQLIKPNSAKQLKELGEKIAKAIHGETFNYEAIDNMLDRTFMSRLRHAFVSGKHAIAIAAVSQTNHSLNQRQPMVIDPSLLGRTSAEDQEWLGDGRVKFSKFNRIKVGNQMLPTLSKIVNAAEQHISDIIAQFIDGYVDISKGPWIMELGAAPNVAPTFLFLVKIGVPIEDIAYFMNQPLIRHYLKEIESHGYVWLFNSTIVDKVKADYATEEQIAIAASEIRNFTIPSKGTLEKLVGKEYKSLTKQEIQDQLKMLDEFLKYAKMATHLFNITQATNYDTATFNDPLLIWKKEQQMKKANETLISDTQSLLDHSFIGSIPKVLGSARNAVAKILISDQTKVRRILQQVLLPYIDMSDNDFLKIAKKATADIFDYAVQTNGGFNQYIKELFNEGIVDDIANFVDEAKRDKNHPLHDNYIINTLQISPSPKGTENAVNNIKIRGIDNKVYDQNNIIYAFREIRDTLGEDSEIYRGLINVAILQSGLSPSTISYTTVIPFEDFAEVYNKTLSRLEVVNLQPFVDLGVFYRNNWNNDDIVSRLSAFWIKTARDTKMYNISMAFFNNSAVKDAIAKEVIPPLTTIPLANKESSEKYIFYTWNLMDELLTEKDWNDINSGKVYKLTRIFAIQEEMRKKSDFSYMKKALFQQVVNEENKPLMTEYKKKFYVVYKAISAWGDGSRANEFYNTENQSIIDNGLENPKNVDDADIISLFLQPNVKKARKRGGGYLSTAAIDEEYSKKSPIAKMVNERDTNKKKDNTNAPNGKPDIGRTSKKC